MKRKQIDLFICEICKESYDSAEGAELCESKPLSEDKGVEIGDTVLITGGEGSGKYAKVTSVGICSRSWGHYSWKRYWHTVCVSADIIGDWGSRLLTFDHYETI